MATRDIVEEIERRLSFQTLSAPGLTLRWVYEQDLESDPATGMEGLEIALSDVTAYADSGGGRYGYKLTHSLLIRLTSLTGLEDGGNRKLSILSHCEFRDALIDVMHDGHPQVFPQSLSQYPVYIRYLGSSTPRTMTDTLHTHSTHRFEVMAPFKFTVRP